MIEVTVRCGCSRTMRPDTYAGPGRYVCGCGAKIALSGLPRHEPSRCPLPRGNRVCNGPKRHEDPVCQPCAIAIAKGAMADPEAAEQIGASVALGDFLRGRELELERRRDEERERAEAFEQRDDARKCCVVYYCEVRPGVVKIGTTFQLAVRINSFRVEAASVLAAEPGYFQLEKLRHRQFAGQRLDPHREDFRLDDELRGHIEQVRATHGDPYELVAQIRARQEKLAQDRNSELSSAKVG